MTNTKATIEVTTNTATKTVSRTIEALAPKAPYLAVVFSVLLVGYVLHWNLAREARSFQSEFIRQNLSELASGDTLSLSHRLETLSGAFHWTCIEGERNGLVFYSRKTGSCGDGLMRQQVNFGIAGNRDIQIRMTITIPQELLLIAAILISGQILLLIFIARSGRLLERTKLSSVLEKERAENAANRSLAAMTSMLAHDARRPLSITKLALEMLSQAEDLPSARKIVSRFAPELDLAVTNIDGLISDVMEIGSHSKTFLKENIEVTTVLALSLTEVFRGHPKSRVKFQDDFKHKHVISANPLKLQRVFSNVIANAAEAMNFDGIIYFSSTEENGFLHLCIGNAGNYVEDVSRESMFDLFFTEGKPGGTGLGLAIAKKIIEAHGGEIWCESSKSDEFPAGFVQFKMTIPLAVPNLASHPKALDSSSQESFLSRSIPVDINLENTREEKNYPEIAIIDDSILVGDAWELKLRNEAMVRTFESPEEFLETYAVDPLMIKRLSCVVTDYYFESSSKTGLDIADSIKSIRSDLRVLLSSDRVGLSLPSLPPGIDGLIDKKPVTFSELQHLGQSR